MQCFWLLRLLDPSHYHFCNPDRVKVNFVTNLKFKLIFYEKFCAAEKILIEKTKKQTLSQNYALNHLNIRYFVFFEATSGTAIMKRFRTVVANLPFFTISVAVIALPDFLTVTM
jgi:hypothetical protein